MSVANEISSERPKVLFRADAGEFTGFGHLVRSAALASYLKDDFECMFVCRCDVPAAEEFVDRVIAGAGARRIYVDVPEDASKELYNKEFLVGLEHDHITVLDNYYYDRRFQLLARDRSRALVSVDDIPGRESVADVFFTPSPLSEDDFKLELDTLFYGGVQWAFLREPFLEPARKREGDKIGRVVMCLGGADPLELTGLMTGVVRKVLPDAHIDVIAGPAAVINCPVGPDVTVHRNADARQIKELMDGADFGVFTASTTCIEAMARKLPMAVGWFAGNQKRLYYHGVDNGLFAPIDDIRRREPDIEEDLRRAVENYSPDNVPEFDFNARKQDIIKIFKDLWKDSAIRFS